MGNDLSKKANLVRKWCLVSTTEAGSGHPTSCLSAADIMTVLFDTYYTYDLKNPHNLANDRLIFSKGHAAPLFYALYALAGAFPIEELKTLRKFTSRLEGHPTPHFPYTEAATGSLGQGLSAGAGLAIGLQREKRLEKKPNVYILLGDGEMAEGEIWEAANFASYYHLNNLIAIVDVNRLGQSQPTMFAHHTKEYANRFAAFGWETIVIDGHDFVQINQAFVSAKQNNNGKPVAIIAETIKGKGISFLEDKEGWHGKPLPKDKLDEALKKLGDIKDKTVFHLRKPSLIVANLPVGRQNPSVSGQHADSELPYKIGDEVGTREVYGKSLVAIGKYNENIMSLDGDMKNSTYSMDFLAAFPDRFIECFIAEQNMVSVAVGLSRLGKIPFVSTFVAFLTRACDQIRVARLSHANIKFAGSHAGVSLGQDGTSQMGLEDIAMFNAIPDSIILQPSDAVSATKLISEIAKYDGIAYFRMLRPKTPVIYNTDEEFVIGGSKIIRSSKNDVVTIIATGITIPEAIKAYGELKKENIFIRIIDAYSIKPVDKKTILESLQQTQQKVLITVEDHYEHGGLGDNVLSAVAEEGVKVIKMAVTKISHSGTTDEVLDDAGINARNIIKKVKSLI